MADDASASPITVVVATRDRPAMLEHALGALSASLRAHDAAIVVDSASIDPAVRTVAERAGVHYLRCERPGTCLARNTGLAGAETDLVAFMDDDCLPEPGWIAALARAFADPSSPDFVTGRIESDERKHSRAQVALSLTTGDVPLTFEKGADPDAIGHGANMAWRRSVLSAIGGFDEQMGPGAPLRAAEDADVFWRALRAGFVGRFEPAAVVIHRQWRTRAAALRTSYSYGIGGGALAVKQARLSGDGAPAPSRSALAAPFLEAIRANVRDRYEMGALVEAVRLAGALSGWRRSRSLALRDGRFVAP
jgi:glycosyltransferase involved in cell wall biosynthesis